MVDYNDLARCVEVLAFFLPEAPSEMLSIFDEVGRDILWFDTTIEVYELIGW